MAIVFKLGMDALAQQEHQIPHQGIGVHSESGQQLLPTPGGALQELEQIETPAPFPEDLKDAIPSAAQELRAEITASSAVFS